MWEEKNFFDKYAVGIERPRDDKPNSIRLMLERCNLSSKEFQAISNENGHSNGNGDSSQDPEWVHHLPISLKGIYADQKEALKSGQCAPQSLGTMPLKELVRTMHTRIGAIVKY